MSSPSLSDLLRCTLHLSQSPDECVCDSLDGSSTELTDVFDEDFCENDAWSPAPADLPHRVAEQLEMYLSDDNLAADAFLLKHVQKNKHGFVSLKLLTSFKKVRELTRDWRTTLAAARSSCVLEVNAEGTKVRRRAPLPDWLLHIPTSKQLLAWELPGDSVGEGGLMEQAMRVFAAFGSIASLRVLRPGRELPQELRRMARGHAELGTQVCAVVEYELLDSARRAYEALRQGSGGPRVAMLGARATRRAEAPACGRRGGARRARPLLGSLDDPAVCSSSESEPVPGSPRPVRLVSRPRSLYGSPLSAARALTTDPYSNPMVTPRCSPLLPRRLFGGASPLGAQGRVVRQPQGPDGSRGFYNCLGRGKLLLRQ